ncbi:hypothetical protein M434DRAFT_396832 [Hypoxylon sp. CO27-5]|nr:hypothetical protein M434DRAFT_396832 [Hypoxylon sp. CO27-5]
MNTCPSRDSPLTLTVYFPLIFLQTIPFNSSSIRSPRWDSTSTWRVNGWDGLKYL